MFLTVYSRYKKIDISKDAFDYADYESVPNPIWTGGRGKMAPLTR